MKTRGELEQSRQKELLNKENMFIASQDNDYKKLMNI